MPAHECGSCKIVVITGSLSYSCRPLWPAVPIRPSVPLYQAGFLSGKLPVVLLNDSQLDSVVRRMNEVLLGAEIALGRLHRRMAQ